MVTATRLSTVQPATSQAAAEGSNAKSEGLGAATTGGLAAGITVVGIAVIALIAWLVIRKRRRAAQTSEATGVLPNQSDNSNEKTDYYRQNGREPIHELPGDEPFTMNSRASNRMSELDSIRPLSELDLTSPMSELSSNQTTHGRWSINSLTMLTSPVSLPDVQEDEELGSTLQPGRFSHIRTARASKSHRRFSSV
jgi:hypothetical protein